MTYVYDFTEGSKDQKDLLGGKGANLAEMTNLGLPVPPGFTISTEACRAYLEHGREPAGLAGGASEHHAAPPPASEAPPRRRSASTSPRSRRGWAAGWASPTVRCWCRSGRARSSR